MEICKYLRNYSIIFKFISFRIRMTCKNLFINSLPILKAISSAYEFSVLLTKLLSQAYIVQLTSNHCKIVLLSYVFKVSTLIQWNSHYYHLLLELLLKFHSFLQKSIFLYLHSECKRSKSTNNHG